MDSSFLKPITAILAFLTLFSVFELAGAYKDFQLACAFSKPHTTDIENVYYKGYTKAVTAPSTGATYRYIHIPPSGPKPYLYFIHGVPSPFDWRHQIEYFSIRGYGIIAPDLRGFGGTDGSGSLDDYRLKTQADELADILRCEAIRKVIGISHDYGSSVHSRFLMYHADFFLAHVFIDVGFAGPGALPTLANIEKINNSTMQELGYPTMGYWYFYQEDDAPELLDSHAEAAFSMFYTSTPAIWKQLFSPVGAFKSWLLSKEPTAVPTYITSKEKMVYAGIQRTGGGFRNTLKTYLAQLNDVNAEDERMLPTDFLIPHPVLLITGSEDPVSLAEIQVNGTKPFSPDLLVQNVQAGHFIHVEHPEVTNKYLEEFFRMRTGGNGTVYLKNSGL